MQLKHYKFEEFSVDVSRKRLLRNDEIVSITPKVFELLVVFVERKGEVLSHEELLEAAWGGVFVEESNLRVCIHALRKIFDGRFIETITRCGYQFNADISEVSFGADESQESEFVVGKTENIQKTSRPIKPNAILFRRLIAFVIVAVLLVSIGFYFGVFSRNGKQKSDKISIAVLPFVQIGEKSTDGLAVADATIAQLSKIREFQILPINSVQKYSNSEVNPLSAGLELEISQVLHGSFRQDGDTVNVSVRLLSVEKGEQLWTETFDLKADKDFGIDNSIAARIARLFSLAMVESGEEKVAKSQNVSPEALSNYLSARRIWRSRDLGRVKEMNSLLQKTLELEPNWALPQTALAESFMTSDFSLTVYQNGVKAANRAIEIDEKQAGAYVVLGQAALQKDFNINEAEAYFKKAIEIDPNYASAYNEYGILLSWKRNFAESEKMLKKAIELEPFSPYYNTSLCQNYYYDKKTEFALKQCKLAMQLEPGFWIARKQIFWIYVNQKMDWLVAQTILSGMSEEEKSKSPFISSLQNNELEEYWKATVTRNEKNPKPLPDAMVLLQNSEREKALSNLELAFDQKAISLPIINADPIFDGLRGDPKFKLLLKKLNLE